MASPGRPTKLSPEIQDEICKAISIGAQYEAAAIYGGITVRTFYNWMSAGENAQGKLDADPDCNLEENEQVYLHFFHAIHEANASNQIYHVNNLHNLAPTNSSVSQWILMNRHKYGQPTRIEVTGRDGGAIETKDITDPVEKAARIAAMLEIAKKRQADEI